MRHVAGAAGVVGRGRPGLGRGLGRQLRFWSLNDRVIQADADSQPRKLRDDPESHGAGALPTGFKRRSSERDASKCNGMQRSGMIRVVVPI